MRTLGFTAGWITAATLCAVAALGQDIRFTTSPEDNQVLQRSSDRGVDIPLAGAASGKKINGKDVETRVTGADGMALPGFDWTFLGRIEKLHWGGALKQVPVGGPYRLEVRLQGTDATLSVANLLVGDLWVLAGQSNMEGHGDLMDVEPPSPLVHSFDMADRWEIAEEPLHTTVSAVDPVHWPLNAQHEPERLQGQALETYIANRKKGAGLGLPFAADMVTRTGVPVGLIPCAHGGTSMEQWSPALKDRGGDSLYGSMVRRVQAVGGRVKGILWYQGESDATPKYSAAFLAKFESFVKAVRADFQQPNLPFYYVQIGRHVDNNNVDDWNRIQLAQLKAESEIAHSGMVATVDLQLDDNIHVGTQDLKRLAHRLANRVCLDLFAHVKDFGSLKPGPHPVDAVFAGGVVKVSFSGVNGRLKSEGPLAGFSIRNAKGDWLPLIYKTKVDPAEASAVSLYVEGKLPEDALLWYGFGKDPYCNLRDESDMAAPVFAIKIHSSGPAAKTTP